jgi:hypothetical protein
LVERSGERVPRGVVVTMGTFVQRLFGRTAGLAVRGLPSSLHPRQQSGSLESVLLWTTFSANFQSVTVGELMALRGVRWMTGLIVAAALGLGTLLAVGGAAMSNVPGTTVAGMTALAFTLVAFSVLMLWSFLLAWVAVVRALWKAAASEFGRGE